MRPSAPFALVVLAGCDVLTPPPPVVEPEPAWHASVPVADVRILSDVIVLEPFGDAEDYPAYHGWAVGADGTILRLDRLVDGSVTWTREESGTTADLESIDVVRFGDGEELVMAVGHDGAALVREDDGAWRAVNAGTNAVLFDVTFRNQDDGFVVGDAGTILRWNGAGLAVQTTQTFQLVEGGDGSQNFFPIPEPLKGVGESDGAMIAVGARGAVYRYDPNGEPNGAENRWTREDAGTQRTLAGIDTESGVTVPTIDGVLMRRNGANDWDDDNFRVPSPVFLQDVWTRGHVTAVGLSEDIFQLDDEGLWNLTRVADAAELRGVDGVRIEIAPGEPGNEDGEEPLRLEEIYVVGGGGRVIRGPLALPGNGESPLETRIADDDFVE